MTVQLILVALSLLSLLSVRWILVQPSRAVEHLVFVPTLVASVPDTTLDWRGLV